jgi:hypothetical protein
MNSAFPYAFAHAGMTGGLLLGAVCSELFSDQYAAIWQPSAAQ